MSYCLPQQFFHLVYHLANCVALFALWLYAGVFKTTHSLFCVSPTAIGTWENRSFQGIQHLWWFLNLPGSFSSFILGFREFSHFLISLLIHFKCCFKTFFSGIMEYFVCVLVFFQYIFLTSLISLFLSFSCSCSLLFHKGYVLLHP